MRKLIWFFVILTLAISAWWFYASSTVKSLTEDWFIARKAEGWRAETSEIAIQGFPNRIDLTFNDLDIAPPRSQWSYKTDFVQLFSLTYKPWHLILAFAPNAQIGTPFGPADLTLERLQASLVVSPTPSVPLERAQLYGTDIALSQSSRTLRAESLAAAIKTAAEPLNAYDIGVDLTGLALPDALGAQLAALGLPAKIAALHLDARADLSAPIDRSALAGTPRIDALQLRALRLQWGEMQAQISGQITPDAAGLASGALDLRIRNAAPLLHAAQAAGALSPFHVQILTQTLAGTADSEGYTTLPIKLEKGRINLLGFPVAAAPRFPQL